MAHPDEARPMPEEAARPLMYGELAAWWPLLSAPEDYAEEASHYTAVLKERCALTPRTLLELGSGGGNNASHMKRAFGHVTLVDLSPDMLAVSRSLNPECEHHVGDMRHVRLGRCFDCVFVHDAICYATTRAELRGIFETAYVHCEPGGAALFAPDFVRETFRESTEHGGRDHDDGRGLRYLEWTWDPDPADTTYRADYVLALRESDGEIRLFHDRHVEGLFPTLEWQELLEEVGFAPQVLRHQYSDVAHESVVIVGRKGR